MLNTRYKRRVFERKRKAQTTGMEASARDRFKAIFKTIIENFDNHPSLSKEILEAKQAYFDMTGKLKDQDVDFTNRMNSFLLWLAFDWRSPTVNLTPLAYHLELLRKKDLDEEYDFLMNQITHVHSLFNFIKQKQNVTIVQDVFTGVKHEIWGETVPVGHIKGSLFETRIFTASDDTFFANYFIHHPVQVKRDLLKKIKTIRRQKKSIKPFLHQLHSYHTKWTNYRNINIHSIYHFDSSIPSAK